MKYTALMLSICLFYIPRLAAEDGYQLWLRYEKIQNTSLRNDYLAQIPGLQVVGDLPLLQSARKELHRGVSGLLDREFPLVLSDRLINKGTIVGVMGQYPAFDALIPPETRAALHDEGYAIFRSGKRWIVVGFDGKGALYGVFRLLQLMQQHKSPEAFNIVENPKIKLRVLNHWDNLDRTIERGYAGFSIWNWHQLPGYLDPRYEDYARANASVGINGAAVTNVNANALVFRRDYLEKAAALADIFRKYGIKIYLTARFSSPIELGKLKTADPLDPEVQRWWQEKTREIYQLIPDFGGFLVKANSEGQPGPQQYGRSHADGANMLADAVAPFGGVVMWRAFVYSPEAGGDRFRQAYEEFQPLDGKFRENVLIQVKNGPVDFQPREPVSPLFGAMPQTPVMLELQITKEYLGQGTHLVGLARMYEEILGTDTYAKGEGSTLAKVTDGSLFGQRYSGIAGVSNIGNERNWTGHLFGQADWFAFGRLAWNPYLSASDIYKEWTRLTFSVSDSAENVICHMLESSHEACVKYMTPLGLHHLMATDHHYGPGPWIDNLSRADWNPAYYHRADARGLGFDRTPQGSRALEQYFPGLRKRYENPDSCPEAFLLWFHHVEWSHKLSNRKSLWENLCLEYHAGVAEVSRMKNNWQRLKPEIDPERYESVLMHLNIQEKEARWWRDACLSYFQTHSKLPFPAGLEAPAHSLEYYQSLSFPYSPGIRPGW